jgi:taurine dioxygenase
MAARVVPLGPLTGAEIAGVDAAAGVGEADMQVIREALHASGVIVLRDQRLTPAQQVAFARQLGELRVSFFNKFAVEDCPELTIVSNIRREDGTPIGLVDAGALWHVDGSYLPKPDAYTVLYAQLIPERDGKALGDTAFAHNGAALAALPAGLQQRLRGLRALHSITEHVERKGAAGFYKPPIDHNATPLPDVSHPVVRRHPVTGQECLLVTEGHTKEIEGMDSDESAALLRQLWDHSVRPEFVYQHNWRPGDLLAWDNCTVQHLAISDYGNLPRRLHRAGIGGGVPA